MLQIQDTLISLDVIEKKFCCDLSKCKGVCCVEGDSGAPLTDGEVDIIEQEYENFKPYLRPEALKAIEEQGTWVIDSENDKVTPLVNNKECAYVVFEGDIAKCGIEKAYFDGKTRFRKPVSCHLYPVRVKKYRDFTAVNYDEWEICKPALRLGMHKGVYVYAFLEDPLVRRFGEEWYSELRIAAESLLNSY
ncbi:MAG: DUF3109 family protein [Bacteroidales bacterium]|nr:DUF3109 family protein [Bacteroidales bacterium]